MNLRRKLLWIDGPAGLVAGMVVLLFSGWLSEWYRLPRELLVFTGVANLVYGSYSMPLAILPVRPGGRIVFLACANMAWAGVCLVLAVLYGKSASLFGLGHLVLEAIFVGGLGYLEWRWREGLRSASPRDSGEAPLPSRPLPPSDP